MKASRASLLASTVAAGAALALSTVGASADTFDFTSCHITGSTCEGGSIPAPGFGSVTLTDNGTGGVTFDITLINGNRFVETGFNGLFFFNDSISGSTITDITATLNGATVSLALSGFTNVSPANQVDGTGDFTAFIACTNASDCNGGSITNINDLHFTVTDATVAQLETANSSGNLFVADILCGAAQTQCSTLTGPVDVTNVAVPAPLAGAGLPGLIAGCMGLFGLARRRRRRQQVVA